MLLRASRRYEGPESVYGETPSYMSDMYEGGGLRASSCDSAWCFGFVSLPYTRGRRSYHPHFSGRYRSSVGVTTLVPTATSIFRRGLIEWIL